MKDAFPRAFRIFLVGVAGALAASAVPQALEALAPGVPLLWGAARALGLLAYLSIWLSTLFGVFVAERGSSLLDRATVLQLHRSWALASLVATALHVLAIVADRHAGVSALEALVPFTADRLRGPVALGTVALWGMASIAASTAAIKRLPPTVWRAIHASAFGTFVLALVHGATAGTETAIPLVRGLYAGTAVVLVGAIGHRILVARAARPAVHAKPAPAA